MVNPLLQFRCRICQGLRPHNGANCLGCGSPIANAIDRSVQKKKVLRCPGCGSQQGKLLEPGRYSCRFCNAVYESEDGTALDDRPDVNLEKREAARERERRQSVHRRYR